jgi:hypothetical protein
VTGALVPETGTVLPNVKQEIPGCNALRGMAAILTGSKLVAEYRSVRIAGEMGAIILFTDKIL